MEKLLIEIGSEEIPAGYIEPALEAFSANLLKKLTAARIEFGKTQTYGTPRRLAIEVRNVAPKQKTVTTEVLGPPQKVGFDLDGNPTVAAQKFAQKIGVPVTSLTVKETQKGAYIRAEVVEQGLATSTILKQILPEVILSIPFPKTMKWADLNIQYARPIHSLMALYGARIVSFQLDNIRSNRYTRGHSFMHPDKLKIDEPGQYVKTLRSAKVLVNIETRRRAVAREIAKAAAGVGGNILEDSELLDTVTNLVEYPVATAGKFDEDFLELPREILITAMREHQKYFAVVDKKGNLMPYFIAVNNTRTKDLKLVATGHERVLRARLADAQFFYQSDLKVLFDAWIERLQGVLFQAKLGSMYDKVQRVKKVAEYLAQAVVRKQAFHKRVSRAAELCKADLVTQVVVEFPRLQGVMGRVYAGVAKEADDVAAAIEEHYRPTHSGGMLPETETGAVLAIADKIDSICGCFSVGLVPTGASDPYALRRQGIGIINIVRNKGFTFSLKDMIIKSLKLFAGQDRKSVKETTARVMTFLANRMARQLAEEGFSKDVIAAVVSVDADRVPDVWNRVAALEKLKGAPDFEPLAVAFKRVVNIIKKAEDIKQKKVDEKLFQEPSEKALFAAYQKIHKKVLRDLELGRFEQALLEIAKLRDPVDVFFEDVLVMATDRKVRNNRLALLGLIADLFGKFADFSKLST